MTIFWFALCMIPSTEFDEGFALARCYTFDRVSCEAYFDECYRGFIPTPVRRKE